MPDVNTEPEPAAKSGRTAPTDQGEKIFAAAVSIFAEHGYHKTSMDEIAEAAGISKPTLYAYLGSKAELYRMCMRRVTEALIEAISSVVSEDLPIEEQLWRGLNAFFSFVARFRDEWRVLYQQVVWQEGPAGDEAVATRRLLLDNVTELLGRAAVRQGNPLGTDELRGLSTALVGAAESLSEGLIDHPGQRPEDTSRQLMNLLWQGLGGLLHGEVWPGVSPAGT